MLLVREDIEAMMARPRLEDRLIITPMLDKDRQLGPATVDIRLGTEFVEQRSRLDPAIDPVRSISLQAREARERLPVTVPLGQSVVLHPGHFLLGCTLEFVRLPPDVGGQVLSRSSWGRVGLTVATAVALQPGWTGVVTLQLVNLGTVPILLHPGLRVAQLMMWRAAQPTSHPYGSDKASAKYTNPLGPQESYLPHEKEELTKVERTARRLGVHVPNGQGRMPDMPTELDPTVLEFDPEPKSL